MGFAQILGQELATGLLRRSLAAGRLAHGLLFEGEDLPTLEAVAVALAKTLNCARPKADAAGPDACDRCEPCRRIEAGLHADIQWIRPESKLRVITIDQMREAMKSIHLKPVEGKYKCTILCSAERLNVQAANAFLKTLEEPPASTIIMLLSPEPQRLLDTIRSRCVRIRLAGPLASPLPPEDAQWLESFIEMGARENGGLLGRYRLLSSLLERLNAKRESIESRLSKSSPLERYSDVDPKLRELWEVELKAAIESEYRLERGQLLVLLEWWLRDLWLVSSGHEGIALRYPEWEPATRSLGSRIRDEEAAENLNTIERLQRQLASNVQEALAIEVGFLRLKL